MTRLEEFAKAAMQSLLSNHAWTLALENKTTDKEEQYHILVTESINLALVFEEAFNSIKKREFEMKVKK